MFKYLQSCCERYYKKTVWEKGVMITLTAVLLPVIIGLAGLAFDAGNLYVHKAKLQNTADAAALAGGRAYVNSLGTGAGGSVTLTQEQLNAKKSILIAAADEYIAKNNPLYKEKVDNGQGNSKKSYAMGKETKAEDSNKSTEYFRVTLTETVPVYLLPVLGIPNIADVSVYATVKMTDTEVKAVKTEPDPYDDDHDPLIIAGRSLINEHKGSNTYNFKAYVTDQEHGQSIQADKYMGEDGKYHYYLPSSNGRTDIDQTKTYNMDTFGQEMLGLFKQKQTDWVHQQTAQDPNFRSDDTYYMTYHGDSTINIDDVSRNPGNYGLNPEEHSYLYISKSDSGLGGIHLKLQGSLYTGGDITNNTPYYIFVNSDVSIGNFHFQSDCNRPIVFCYMGESGIKYHFHANVKGILYSPHSQDAWIQINNNKNFCGTIISDYVRIQANKKTTFEYSDEELVKWMEGEDGLKFTPSIGFYQDPGSGSSSGSGGTSETVNEISLPDRLRLVLAGSTTDASHYKDSAVEWSAL